MKNVLEALAGLLVLTGLVAAAEENPHAPVQRQIEAPVGHRQPRPQDLPHAFLRDKRRRTDQQIDFDKN